MIMAASCLQLSPCASLRPKHVLYQQCQPVVRGAARGQRAYEHRPMADVPMADIPMADIPMADIPNGAADGLGFAVGCRTWSPCCSHAGPHYVPLVPGNLSSWNFRLPFAGSLTSTASSETSIQTSNSLSKYLAASDGGRRECGIGRIE